LADGNALDLDGEPALLARVDEAPAARPSKDRRGTDTRKGTRGMKRLQSWRRVPAASLLTLGGTPWRAEAFAIQSLDEGMTKQHRPRSRQ
jgi:hypothetical protein